MRQFVRQHRTKIVYLVVGGWNTLFGYGAFAVLYLYLSSTVPPVAILTASYVLGITNAYVGYKLFVFRTKGNVLREYLRLYVVYGGAYVANLALLPLLMGVLRLNAYVAQGIIVLLTVIGSFVLHKRFTFRHT